MDLDQISVGGVNGKAAQGRETKAVEDEMTIWWILLAAAFFALFFLGRGGPNAIGGTATLGALVGVGIAFYQPGFDWWIVGKAMVIGTFIGVMFEWLPVIFGAIKPERPE